MANVDDVAAAVLELAGTIDTYKLQKLVYYCQAWHLVWEDEPLFSARVEAWANGPVVPKLYQRHRGAYRLREWAAGDATRLKEHEFSTVEMVVDFYGDKSGAELAALTHREYPWRDARRSAALRPGERGDVEISKAAMLEYYGGLVD